MLPYYLSKCILTMGWAVVAGIVFRNTLSAVSVTTMILFVDQFVGISVLTVASDALRMLSLFLSPKVLASHIILPEGFNIIFDTSYAFTSWFNAALPYYALIVMEIITVLQLAVLQ